MAGPMHTYAYFPYHSCVDPGLKTYSSSNPLLLKHTEFLLPCIQMFHKESKFSV